VDPRFRPPRARDHRYGRPVADVVQWRVDVTIACLLLAMLLAAWIGWYRWQGAAVLGLFSLAWISSLDKQFEGPVLWHLGASHGVVLADLAGVAGLVVAGVLTLRLALRPRGQRRAQ
jgi:hypothetical protein